MAADKHRRYALTLTGALCFALATCWWLLSPLSPNDASRDVNVFAAASLRDVMSAVGAQFSQRFGDGGYVRFNTAGSNVLAQQILASSQADLFISADDEWMDKVEIAGRLIADSRQPFLSNRIVIIAHASTDWKIDNAADILDIPFRHLSLADPGAVPAGRYAKAFLESSRSAGASLWSRVADRVAPALDVRAALALVEADPTVLGIVYRTDAAASRKVRIVFEVPIAATPPVRYSVARVHRTASPPLADDFYRFLFSDEARAIFAQYGFIDNPDGTIAK
jgi:molybdate transport system substrate-binding protein